jgi:DNA-binding transcriptional MerR regulator
MAERTYRIGEAASLLNLKTYVLRFWETEFPQLVPLRTEKGQRLYTEADLALLRRIRFLLHERGLTIEGARRMLAERGAAPVPGSPGRADVAATGGLTGFGEDDPGDAALSGLPGDDDSPADAEAAVDFAAGLDDDAPADAGVQGRILSASASRVQAWDQYLHGLLLPEDGDPVPAGDRNGHVDPQSAETAPGSGASVTSSGGVFPGGAAPGTVRAIIAELEAMRRLLAGAD